MSHHGQLSLRICNKVEAFLLIFSFSSSTKPTQITKTPSLLASPHNSSLPQHKALRVKSAH
uniref:Uncharacterized protein n=1 Tax=Rhizophora mucronata TaxID=61149 RepID=A0A2P2PTJ4_RHIMU